MVENEDLEKRILVVEDEAPIRDMLKDLLQSSGFGVDLVADGTKGLERFQESKDFGYYDVVLTDYNLPGMDGIQLLKEIKKANPATQVVFHSSSDVGQEAYDNGAIQFFKKPADYMKLIAYLNGCFERVREIRRDTARIYSNAIGNNVNNAIHPVSGYIELAIMDLEDGKLGELKEHLTEALKATQETLRSLKQIQDVRDPQATYAGNVRILKT